MDPRSNLRAGTAYFVPATGDGGPGVLVLASWWGLTADVKERCHDLADAGFTVLAPDLSLGRIPGDVDEAAAGLGGCDPNEIAALVLSSVATLRGASADPAAPISVIGYFSGASWALWLGTRQPDSVRRIVAYYGTQDIDFADLTAPLLGHFGRPDAHVTEDQITEMHAHLLLLDKDVRIHRYDADTFFAERGPTDASPRATPRRRGAEPSNSSPTISRATRARRRSGRFPRSSG